MDKTTSTHLIMSAGPFETVAYSTDTGAIYPIKIQPETMTLSIDGTANAAPAGPIQGNLPSAQVSKGRRAHGINARLVRFRFTGAVPPGYKPDGVISLPVLSQATYAGWGKGQTGTYSIQGTDYAIAFVGKTPEKIN